MIQQSELKQIYHDFLEKKDIKEIINFCVENKGKNYSILNYLLAWKQAEQQDLKFYGCLKPFSEWKKENTYIKSGAKSLKIFAPTFSVYEDSETKERKQSLRGFIPVPVFDIGQTDSSAIKEYQEKENKILYTRFENALINFDLVVEQLKNYCNISIEYDPNKINGCFIPSEQKIIIRNNNLNTLLHEFGHFLSYNDKLSYEKNEILAEVGSYLLIRKLGYSGEFNKNYANSWANSIKEWKLGEFEKAVVVISDKIDNLNLGLFAQQQLMEGGLSSK